MILVVLQNAWRRKAKSGDREFLRGQPKERSDKVWRIALERSRSGQRLAQMLPEGVEWTAINASPFVGNESKSHYPFDEEHVVGEIARLPFHDTVLLCGVEAQKAEDICLNARMKVVKTFHPAYRLLTTVECAQIRRRLTEALHA